MKVCTHLWFGWSCEAFFCGSFGCLHFLHFPVDLGVCPQSRHLLLSASHHMLGFYPPLFLFIACTSHNSKGLFDVPTLFNIYMIKATERISTCPKPKEKFSPKEIVSQAKIIFNKLCCSILPIPLLGSLGHFVDIWESALKGNFQACTWLSV